MKKLKRIIAILLILSFQADVVAHFTDSFVRGSQRAWWDLFTLYRAYAATTYFADGALGSNCSTYIPATHVCGAGGSSFAYGTNFAVQNALNVMVGGDTLEVRSFAGFYIGTGGSILWQVKSGASTSNRVTVRGYQGELPIARGFRELWYAYLKDFIIDGQKAFTETGIWSTDESIVENVEIRNAGGHGMLYTGTTRFLNMNVHDNGYNTQNDGGGPYGYGVYVAGSKSGNTFDGGRYHHNAGWGILCYTNGSTCGTNTFSNLRLDHNGLTPDYAGLYVQGTSNLIYNVIADHNGGPGIWLVGGTTQVYNVPLVGNGADGICIGDGANATVRNAIAVDNSGVNLQLAFGCNGTAAGAVTPSNNTSTGTGSDYFVDAPNGDFHLKSGAPGVIGTGFDLSSIFTCDFGVGTGCLNSVRTVPWDRGAYKFGAGPPADTQPPVIAITSPFADAYTTGTSMLFTGTATDDFGVTSVTYSCTSGSGAASFSASTWSRTQSLNLGANTCVFTAHDLAGNSGSTNIASITVTRVAGPGTGLLASYAFDAGASSIATDSSGNNNHGTLSAGAIWNTSGKFANSLTFDGTGGVTVPDSATLRLIDNWTIEAWINPSVVTGNYRAVMRKGNYMLYAMTSYTFGCNASTAGIPWGAFFADTPGTYYGACDSVPVAPNVWTHVAFTHDGSTLKLYIQGVLVNSFSITGGIPAATDVLYIGASPFGEGFVGKMDNVRIYGRALTQPEIVTNMNTPILAPPNTVTIKLNVSSWKFGPGVTAKFGLQ